MRLAREGAPVNAEQAYILDILWPIHERLAETRELYAPRGRPLGEGDVFRFPELAEALERFGAEGAEPFYRGEVAAALSGYVAEHGGTLGAADLAGYEAIERRPIRAAFRGAEVLTNPPPSSGGILIAYSLGLLERLGESSGPEQLVAAMGAANAARGEAFAEALYGEGLEAELARAPAGASTCAGRRPARLDHPHLGARRRRDVRQRHLLQRLGLGRARPRHRRDPQQHARRGGPQPARLPRDRAGPPGALDDGADRGARDGEIELGLGSAGSNRIRSAIVQTVVRAVEQGMGAGEAVRAPRLHFEQGVVQAEPGIDEEALARIEARGVPVLRRPRINLFFGGVQAVARDRATGALSGGGDPRRGGAVAIA